VLAVCCLAAAKDSTPVFASRKVAVAPPSPASPRSVPVHCLPSKIPSVSCVALCLPIHLPHETEISRPVRVKPVSSRRYPWTIITPAFFTGAGCSSGAVPNPQLRRARSSLCSLRTHEQKNRHVEAPAVRRACSALLQFLAVTIASLMTSYDVMDTFCGRFSLKKQILKYNKNTRIHTIMLSRSI